SRWYCIRIVLYIPRIERWYHDRFLIGVLAFQRSLAMNLLVNIVGGSHVGLSLMYGELKEKYYGELNGRMHKGDIIVTIHIYWKTENCNEVLDCTQTINHLFELNKVQSV
ncbi:hypothetical protein ACJX0J_035052, partial [Zea mays]